MKLINGVLKEERYKKKGRTLDKIWRDIVIGVKRDIQVRRNQGRGKVDAYYIPFNFLEMKKENRNRNIQPSL